MTTPASFPSLASTLGHELQQLLAGNLDPEAWQAWLSNHNLSDIQTALQDLRTGSTQTIQQIQESLMDPNALSAMDELRSAVENGEWSSIMPTAQEHLSNFMSKAQLPTPPDSLGAPILYPRSQIPHIQTSWNNFDGQPTAPATMLFFNDSPEEVQTPSGRVAPGQAAYIEWNKPGQYKFSSGDDEQPLYFSEGEGVSGAPNRFLLLNPQHHTPAWNTPYTVNVGDTITLDKVGRNKVVTSELEGISDGLKQGSVPGTFLASIPGNYLIESDQDSIPLRVQGNSNMTAIPWQDGHNDLIDVEVPHMLQFVGKQVPQLGLNLRHANIHVVIVKQVDESYCDYRAHPYWIDRPGNYCFSSADGQTSVLVRACYRSMPITDDCCDMDVFCGQPVDLDGEWIEYETVNGQVNEIASYLRSASWSTPCTVNLHHRRYKRKCTIRVHPVPDHCYNMYPLIQQLQTILPYEYSPAFLEWCAVHLRRRTLLKRLGKELFNNKTIPFEFTDDQWEQLRSALNSKAKHQLLKLPGVSQQFLQHIQLPAAAQEALARNPTGLAATLHQFVAPDGKLNMPGWLLSV